MKSLCVFCGSSVGNDKTFLLAAGELGMKLAKKKIKLIYGGAKVGLMGMVAKSCLDNNGSVIGVIPESLANLEIAHNGLTELKIVKDMHQRKALMNELSDAFIALPGGIGTIEETFEMFTWLQLGLHQKPIAILNINGFYESIINFLAKMVKEGFLTKEHEEMLIIEDSVDKILVGIENYNHKNMGKWFDVDKNLIE